ncbi:MAG: HAMP domain-containing histidine kinase [Saprospiraceae bacterium]|nr:HAMP domain-containing histidine kinase [Saprospiraceae bacterium]
MTAGYTHYSFSEGDYIVKVKSHFEEYIAGTQGTIEQIFADTSYLTVLSQLTTNEDIEQPAVARAVELSEQVFTVFIYDSSDHLIFWSNNHAVKPDLEQLQDSYPYLQEQATGSHYLVMKDSMTLQANPYHALALVPIRIALQENPYGHVHPAIPPNLKLSTNPGIPIVTADQEPFIYFEDDLEARLSKKETGILILLYLLAVLALCVLIQKIAYLIRDQMGASISIGFFVFTTLGIRLVSLLFDYSGQFQAYRVFDPAITAPAFRGALSDILINVCLFLWVSIFIINTLTFQIPEKLSAWRSSLYSFIGHFTILSGLVFLARFCQKLIQKTSIDFNFESVFNLDQISILSLISIILLMFTLFIWSTKIVSIIKHFHVPVKYRVFSGISALLLSLPLLLYFGSTVPLIQFALVASIYVLLLDIFLEVKTPNFTWVVLWLVVLSGFSSILLFKFNKDKDIALRKELAIALTAGIDTVALGEIENLLVALEEPLRSADSRQTVRSFVIDILSTSSYLDTYYAASFPRNWELSEAEKIDYGNGNFLRKKGELDHYLINIKAGKNISVVILFEKKKINPYSPLTSLLPIKNFKESDQLSLYDYAIYENNRCIERSHAGYNMILEEDIPDVGESFLYYLPGRSELIFNNGTYITLIGRKLTGLIKPVSLFSYLFVIIVIIILLLLILNSLFPYLPTEFNFTLSNQISLRNKIQTSVLALIILSFIIIGIVTVYYFQNTAEKAQEDRLEKTASSLQYELQERINSRKTSTLDSLFRTVVENLALKYNSHIQLYDENGLLVTTSDRNALDKGYLQDRMSLTSLLRLKKYNESIFIDNNRPAHGRDIDAAYFTLTKSNNAKLGFVGLPVHPGHTVASNQVKDFMGTLLNVYVFLLLIAGAFALAVANSITRPLTVLGQKLKEFKLGTSNEPLEWKTKDEVGVLIREYNEMIVKLDESADLLALTEREVAWREMAKQVAHEIKNPLTPMRLSIQHLQHAMQNADPTESRQLVQRVGITLIEQIDNLSRIAAEFSTFAKMPKPENERIILNELVASVHDLFKKREDMDFNLYVPIDEVYVNADKSHLLRVLNNLIKNAIQAIPASRKGIIDIKLECDDHTATIQVIDNGKGISKEMKEKVFYPNFTTKTSGTGLGLAISKNIIESFGGKIYFETEENVGTTFFFELPSLGRVDVDYYARHHVS